MDTLAHSERAEDGSFHYRSLRAKWYREGWYSRRTFIDALKQGAAEHGDIDVVFVTDGFETTATVAEIHRVARAVAAGLQRLGVGPSDVVAVQLTNRLECVIAYQAVLLCGAVLVPVVHVYGPKEVGFILTESRAKVFIMAAHFRSTVYLDRIADYARIATLDCVVVVDGQRGDDHLSWPELTADPGEYVEPSSDADDVCLLVYTSGTTSAPKGVQHTHNSLLAEQLTMSAVIGGDPADVSLVVFPPGHIAGTGFMLRPLISGTRSVFLESWDPQQAANLIERFAVTCTAGTPFHFMGLLNLADIRGKLATLREFLTGATTVTEEQGRQAHAAGINSFRSYGLTEHPTATVSRDDDDAARLATDGKPLPGSAVRIIGPDGTDLPTGLDGEIVLQGPEQFIGYRDPALNEGAFTADGWFRTGDLGHLDADGRLVVTDRIKDVIIRGGETISSGQVEDVLNAHPAITDGVVVAAPDRQYGEVVGAVVVLKPGAALGLNQLRSHFVKAGLAKQKTPERLAIVDSLPRTAMGKVRKAELRRLHFG